MDQPTTDFDGAWKEALERYLEPFLAHCFPQAHGDIDWATPPQFLDTDPVVKLLAFQAVVGSTFVFGWSIAIENAQYRP